MYEGKVAVAKRKSEPLDVTGARFEAPRADEVLVRIVGAGSATLTW
jgi:Zn-dependent alcohol dehydrogenase